MLDKTHTKTPSQVADVSEEAHSKAPQTEIDIMAEQLLEMIDNFDELLRNETSLLSEGKLSDVAELQEQKMEVAKEYERLLRSMTDKQADFKQISSSSLKERLKAATDTFQHVLKKNLFALKSAQISAKRVSERIAKAALKDIEQEAGTYNARGQIGGRKTTIPAGVTDGAY
tara:strand:- start:1284 stop:1799 length:516 start_codon:yes stop_codon:yes gene_type:complete